MPALEAKSKGTDAPAGRLAFLENLDHLDCYSLSVYRGEEHLLRRDGNTVTLTIKTPVATPVEDFYVIRTDGKEVAECSSRDAETNTWSISFDLQESAQIDIQRRNTGAVYRFRAWAFEDASSLDGMSF